MPSARFDITFRDASVYDAGRELSAARFGRPNVSLLVTAVVLDLLERRDAKGARLVRRTPKQRSTWTGRRIVLTVPQETKARLQHLADTAGVSVSWLVESTIRELASKTLPLR